MLGFSTRSRPLSRSLSLDLSRSRRVLSRSRLVFFPRVSFSRFLLRLSLLELRLRLLLLLLRGDTDRLLDFSLFSEPHSNKLCADVQIFRHPKKSPRTFALQGRGH